MGWRAREITIAGSLALHGVIAFAALSAAHDKKVHRATEVSLAEQKPKEKPPEKKKAEPPKPPPVPPKPKPVVAKAPEPAPAPAAVAPVAAPPVTAPVATDIAMSNDTGMDLGTGHRPRDEQKPGTPAPAKPTPPPAAAKPTAAKAEQHTDATQADAAACTEPAGKPEPTLKTDIAYTDEARAAGIEGRLVLKVTIDAEGNVTDVKVVSGVDAALDAAAIQTVKTWRFKPAMACGKPVAGGSYTIARRFVLGD